MFGLYIVSLLCDDIQNLWIWGNKNSMLEWYFIPLMFVLNPYLVFMNKQQRYVLTYHSIYALSLDSRIIQYDMEYYLRLLILPQTLYLTIAAKFSGLGLSFDRLVLIVNHVL